MSSTGTDQPSKRRRVSESCKGCRAKKTRCDGTRPQCSACLSKNLTCEYNDATVPISTNTLSDIETRLQRLERQTTGDDLAHLSSVTPASSTYNSRQIHSCAPVSEDSSYADNTTTQFMRDMAQIGDAQTPGHLPSSTRRGAVNEFPIETDTSAMLLPRRAVADNLVKAYKERVYPLFPIVHLPTFRKHYEGIWESTKQFENLGAEATFHATLNAVFSLGCLNSDDFERQDKIRISEQFYRRARVILPLDALDVPSIEVVQYLLLTVTYLSFTKYSHRVFNVLAVASRISQTLGLHKDVDAVSNNQLKREMSRRTWHHCMTLERSVVTSRIELSMFIRF